MKIGIAATTYNRPKHIELWAKMVSDYSPDDAICHVSNDTVDRKGIAFRKNECIRELYNEGCDVMFLFDDDTFPIKTGWCDFFIDALKASEQNHFCYLKETPGVKKVKWVGYGDGPGNKFINEYDNCNGCLMIITRQVVEKVGGYNTDFGIYGFEHAEYSKRIHVAGLNTMGEYICPNGASEFIYSCDLDNSRPDIQKRLKHKSSMSSREAIHHINKNREVFQNANQIYRPL